MRPLLFLLFSAVFSACSVYAPMQPHALLLRAAGEGEASLQLQASLRPELQVAYSPLNHLMVLASGTWRPSISWPNAEESDNFRTAQYEVGAGTYWPLGPRWLASATLGTGAAQGQRTVTEFGILLAFSNDYAARYRKNFGQLGLSYQNEHAAVGLTYRLTQVSFQSLTATSRVAPNTVYALPLEGQLRHEPYLFARYALDGPLAQSRWQAHLGVGLSFCLPGRNRSGTDPFDPAIFRAGFNRGGMLLLNAGVVYCLKRRVAVRGTR